MPTLDAAVSMVLASMQARFVGSAATPANWEINVGDELVAELDGFRDICCPGYGAVLVTGGAMEPDTSQRYTNSLYQRVTVALTVLRCAPTIGDDGRSPTAAQQAAYSSQLFDDVERMMRTVYDVAQYQWITPEDISEPQWAPVPPEGGCGGAAVTFEMAVISDC